MSTVIINFYFVCVFAPKWGCTASMKWALKIINLKFFTHLKEPLLDIKFPIGNKHMLKSVLENT